MAGLTELKPQNEEPKKCLFQIKDYDRPMWVVADNWTEALEKWKTVIANENDYPEEDVTEPLGIDFICDDNDLIV